MPGSRIEEIQTALDEEIDIVCIYVDTESCDGIMEYDHFAGTWICNQCGVELGADDIIEEVESQESELWI